MTQGTFDGTVYQTAGEGPPVVLVHGLGLNRHMWKWYVEALAPHFRVVTYDLLGHGESVKHAAPYRMSQFVDQIEALCAHLDVDQCAIAGFSLGGIINRAYALSHPERVRALVILNSYHDRTEEQRAAVLQRVEQARQSGPTATIDAALERWFTPEFHAAHPEMLDQVRSWVTANDAEVYPHLYHLMAMCDADLVEPVRAIRCPTLIIAGEKDPGNTPAMAHAMAALIPDARVEVMPDLRHMGLCERPEAFLALMKPFFASAFS